MAFPKLSFTVTTLLFLVALVSMTSVVFSTSGYYFVLSFILLAGVVLSSLLGMGLVYAGKRWGWTALTPVTLVMLIYSFGIYATRGMVENLALMILSAIVIFVLAAMNMNTPGNSKAPKVQVYTTDKKEPAKESAAKSAKSPSKSPSKKKTAKKKTAKKKAAAPAQ